MKMKYTKIRVLLTNNVQIINTKKNTIIQKICELLGIKK